jgi:hypothetical protein
VFAILATGAQGQGVDTPNWIADVVYQPEVKHLCKDIREPIGGCHIFDVPSDSFAAQKLASSRVFTMVTFKDINDPATAIVVHASGNGPTYIDALAQTFGEGYAFKSAVIEIVSGVEVTKGVEQKIKWVHDYQSLVNAWRGMLNGETTGPSGMPDMLFQRIEP